MGHNFGALGNIGGEYSFGKMAKEHAQNR